MISLLLSGVLAIALAAVILLAGVRVGAPGRVVFVALAILAAAWIGAIGLESTGWKDTDGWVDCNDYCHGWHHVGALIFWTPPLAGLLLLFGLGLRILVRRRRPDTRSDRDSM
jgi:hypothetical protein